MQNDSKIQGNLGNTTFGILDQRQFPLTSWTEVFLFVTDLKALCVIFNDHLKIKKIV